MPGISIHVVDVSRGRVGSGMRVEVYQGEKLVASGVTSAKGLLEDKNLDRNLTRDEYRAVFHVGDYYKNEGVALPERPFLHVVSYDFGIDDPEQHYHLPFKCTPWGYSCFRGGA